MPEVFEKALAHATRFCGAPGATDPEGFDPHADTVGPGIYGGVVRRDAAGAVVWGAQYQGHNPVPGPVYAGGGYTPTSRLLAAGDPGKEILTPVAQVILGGLVSSTLLDMVVTPTLFLRFGKNAAAQHLSRLES
jgi:hypothetical protein